MPTTTEGTWMQITFTLSSEEYKLLQKRAESSDSSVPVITREVISDFLEKAEKAN